MALPVIASRDASTEADDVALLRSWSYDPEKFSREALFFNPTSQQSAAFDEIRKLVAARLKKMEGQEELTEEDEFYLHKMGLSIMSGQGTGKDAICAVLMIWFLTCFPFPKVLVTATTFTQVKDNLWAEVHKWLRNTGPNGQESPIKDWFVVAGDKIYLKEHKGKEWFAIARTANPRESAEEQAETLAGRHEDYMMVVVDEAAGIPEPVFRPLEGGLTGPCNFIVLIFNPTRAHGFAIETQTTLRQYWIPIRWNAEESENVTQESIDYKAKKYGRDSNFYRIRVLGLPPKAEDNALIPWEWVQAAIDRELEPLDNDADVVAIDVGAGGDDSILLRRCGPLVSSIEKTDTPSSENLTGWAMRRMFDIEPTVTFIDTIGVGWGIEGNLRSRTDFTVVGLNVSESADDPTRFHRLRDELFWRLRERFQNGSISIPNDDELVGELTTIRYEEPNGVVKVESKKEMKKRGVESPNKADALAMTEYYEIGFVRKLQARAHVRKRKAQGGPSWKTV